MSLFLHCWRVAGPATKTGGEPPPLHVRALLEGRRPCDQNGRRASAPPRAGFAGGSQALRPKRAESLRPSTCGLCWRVAGPATKTGGAPPPLHVRALLEGRRPCDQNGRSLRPSTCGLCWRVAGPATKTGGAPPPLHVRALLEGRRPCDRNGRRASAPPRAGIAEGSWLKKYPPRLRIAVVSREGTKDSATRH
jgi:hypothetical protein